MLHLRDAGFDFEIATPTGAPAVLEMWAFPSEDENVNGIFEEYGADFANPRSLADFVETSLGSPERYAAVFVPGGHGAMLGIPDDPNVGTVLRWADEHDLCTISLCHGPGAFLATELDGHDFLYRGYKMAVFPDSVDKQTPKIGYLPGPMPWRLSEKLDRSGATVINKKADDTVCLDRRLITGASPQASNRLGELAARTLLDQAKRSGQQG
jgi:molecular chaperone Hsp31 and glyoxalase 3